VPLVRGDLVPGPAAGLALLLAAALLAACGGTGDGGAGPAAGDVRVDDGDALHGSVLDDGWQLPSSSLTSTRGEAVDLAQSAVKPLTVVFFGYTHCPDICLAVMADVTGALNRLEAGQAEQVDVWFVTTDPARDDAATIREWLDRFDPDFEGFTGPLARIVRVAEAVHVPIEKGPRLATGGYEVTHGTPVLGVLPGGEARVVWTEGTSAAKLADDMRAVLDDPGVVGVEG
jgi:protein SCO1